MQLVLEKKGKNSLEIVFYTEIRYTKDNNA